MSNQQAKRALQVIIDNFSFFAAPFLDPEKFQEWAKNNQESLRPLSDKLISALDLCHTKKGVYGGHTLWRTSLIEKNTTMLKQLLKHSDKLVNVILEHANDSIISKWIQARKKDELVSSLHIATNTYKKQLIRKIELEAKSLKKDRVTEKYYDENNNFLVEAINAQAASGSALWDNISDGVTTHTSQTHPKLHRAIELYREADKLEQILENKELVVDKKLQQYNQQLKHFENSLDPIEKAESATFFKKVKYVLREAFSNLSNGNFQFWKIPPAPQTMIEKLKKPIAQELPHLGKVQA